MSKPKIYGFCSAGCKWEIPHKEDVLKMGTFIPVIKESEMYKLNRLDAYRIYRNKYATDWNTYITCVLMNQAEQKQYVSLPLPTYDKYTDHFDFKLLDFKQKEVVTQEFVELYKMITAHCDIYRYELDPNLEGKKYRMYNNSDTEWTFELKMSYSQNSDYTTISLSLGEGYDFVDFRVVSYEQTGDTYYLTYELNGETFTIQNCELDSIYIHCDYEVLDEAGTIMSITGSVKSIYEIVETTSISETIFDFIYEINGNRLTHTVEHSIFANYIDYTSLTAYVTGAERVYFYNDGLNTTCIIYKLEVEGDKLKLVGSDGTVSYVIISGGSLEEGGEEISAYTVTENLTGCTSTNASSSVEAGNSFYTVVSANSGYTMYSIKVIMGGTDITSSVVEGNVISIAEVTGNIVISAVAVADSGTVNTLANTTWKFNDYITSLGDESSISYKLGFTSNGVTYNTLAQTAGDGYRVLIYDGESSVAAWTATDGSTGTWESGYQTISITGGDDATNATLIAWFKANATQVSGAETTTYTVTQSLSHITASNTATSVENGAAYTNVLTVEDGYKFSDISINMGGSVVTDSVFDESTMTIIISSVTGNITIAAIAVEDSSGSETTTYTVTNNLTNCSSSNTSTSVTEGATYSTTITANTGYVIQSITVTMSGNDITSMVTSEDGTISIDDVSGDIVITATAKASTTTTYTVTFKDYDGTVLDTQTVSEGGSATAPTSPTRTGYTFTGWDKSFKNVTSDLTVTAQYTIKKYTVTFNSNGGSSVTSQTVNYGSKATEPTDPTKDGYTFVSWQLNGVDYDFTKAVTSNITLVATWEEVVDLTGTTWVINETPDVSTSATYAINFTYTSISGTSLKIGTASGSPALFYDDSVIYVDDPYAGGWVNSEDQRTITITGGDDVTNADLVTWLEANATQADVYKININFDLPDAASSFYSVNVNFISNGTTFKGIEMYKENGAIKVYYIASGQTTVYDDSVDAWYDEAYRTITILDDVSTLDSSFQNWLTSYTVKQ